MHVEGFKASKSINQKFCNKKSRKSDAYDMNTPARLIQATLSPDFIAPSIERTHYTTEFVKNQDYFKVLFLTEKLRHITEKFQLPLNKKLDSLEKAVFELVKNGLPVMSNSSTEISCRLWKRNRVAN
ncbi:hypothetical protein [Anaerotignum propionicum]|uniref:hypothetical protein n=1 Tax=Anaerotignum propionicum TaxID=28446 RepID=UPI00210B6C3A|nr:hypothetical protein [Anaerotignum propionicum]MCQ4936027.1 hypothetical protein [Anaerotignum propionicum]